MDTNTKANIGFSLTKESCEIISTAATNSNVNVFTALNQIISEWAEKDKIGRLKATEEPTILSEILERLGKVEKFVSQFEFVPDNVVWDYEE